MGSGGVRPGIGGGEGEGPGPLGMDGGGAWPGWVGGGHPGNQGAGQQQGCFRSLLKLLLAAMVARIVGRGSWVPGRCQDDLE